MGGVTLLRHTTPKVPPGMCYGRSDVPLAAAFPQEAEALLAKLPQADYLITSPLTRCKRLAERIAMATGLPLTLAPDWAEMDFGNWEMTPWSDIPRADIDAWAADLLHYRGHGGESVAQLRDRVARALDDLPKGRGLVVTHMGPIRAALHACGHVDAWDQKHPFGGLVPLPSSR